MRPSEMLKLKRTELLEIFSRYPKITNPRIFGSVARDEDREDSDLDLLVDAADDATYSQFCDLQDAISELLEVKVDIITSRSSMNDRMKKRIFTEAREL